MKNWIPIGLFLLGPLWFFLAWESVGRGKNGIAMVQILAGLAFMIRGALEWRKSKLQ